MRIELCGDRENDVTGLKVLLGLVGLNDEALAFRRLTVVGDAGVDGMPAGVDAEAGNL